MLGIVLVIQPPFIFNYVSNKLSNFLSTFHHFNIQEYREEEGFQKHFIVSTILVLVSTAFNSNVAIIVRYLRKLPVASLTSSREIVFVLMTFLTIFIVDVQLKTPNMIDKLKIVIIGQCLYFLVHNFA